MKTADLVALLIEADALLPDRGRTIRRSLEIEGVEAPASARRVGPPLLPQEAEQLFRDTHQRLSAG